MILFCGILAFHKNGPNDTVLREISTWVIFARIAKITLIGIVLSECSTCVTFAKNDSSMLTFCNIGSSSRSSPQLILFCVISSNTSNLQNHAQWYCFRRMFHMCQYCEKRRADGHFLQFWQSCWTTPKSRKTMSFYAISTSRKIAPFYATCK